MMGKSNDGQIELRIAKIPILGARQFLSGGDVAEVDKIFFRPIASV
jgi:hypothetical protein